MKENLPATAKETRTMTEQRFAKGWDEEGVRAILAFFCLAYVAHAQVATSSVTAAEPSADAVLSGVGIRHGLVVHVGATDGGFAESIAQSDRFLVHALALDADAENRIRQRLVKAGIHGQATVGRLRENALPLADQAATIVVADLDLAKGVKPGEVLRVLRPLGKAYLKSGGQWSVVAKSRPTDVDDWAQYYHDGAMSDVSTDRVAGPARGLQWEAGPQDTHSNGVRIVGDIVIGQDSQGIWARDAFNGLPVWRRPGLFPATRFGLLADAERVYIFPTGSSTSPSTPSFCQLALDLRTGATVLEYKDGLTFALPKEFPKDPVEQKNLRQELHDRAKDFQARLHDGILIQASGPGLAVLDAKTGKRLWGAECPEGLVWGHPLASRDTLYAVQGAWASSNSYTHWPMTLIERAIAMDLKTGRQKWAWDWKKEMPAYFAAFGKVDESVIEKNKNLKRYGLEPANQRAGAAYNMALDRDKLVFALRAETKTLITGGGLVRQLVLDARTGKFEAYGRTPADRNDNDFSAIGGGHSGFRVLPVGGRWWFPTVIGFYGNVDPLAPTDAEKFDRAYAKLLRPVGCTVYRASPNYLFGSLTTYALDGSEVQQTNVARTTCDVGAFPANGMSYITPNHCFCAPYLPGHNVFHPRRPKAPDNGERLDMGSRKPAAAPTKASDDSWPTYLRDNLRSSWSTATIPDNLQRIWTVRPARPQAGLIGQEWTNQWHGQGPVTGVSVAEGTAVLALTDRQEVLAVDPATGKERWRAVVEGRIDSQPTIYRGAVYVGTRGGLLYAFNRDTGERIWTFRASPRREQIVVDGQLESVWPLFGTVTVDEEGVWAVAGRHNDCDGGLWWWRLDPATGKIQSSGRFGRDELRSNTGDTGAIAIDPEWPSGANSPPVTDGELFLMPRIHCVREKGELKPVRFSKNAKNFDEGSYWANAYALGILMPGNQGLLNRVDVLNGYKMSAYGFVQGRIFAYRGDQFVCVGGTGGSVQHRGGDRGSWVRAYERKTSLETVKSPNPNNPDQPLKRTIGAEVKWDNPMPLTNGNGTETLAVAGDKVLVGLSVTNSNHHKKRRGCRSASWFSDAPTVKNNRSFPCLRSQSSAASAPSLAASTSQPRTVPSPALPPSPIRPPIDSSYAAAERH